jgi:hypothetical protein
VKVGGGQKEIFHRVIEWMQSIHVMNRTKAGFNEPNLITKHAINK